MDVDQAQVPQEPWDPVSSVFLRFPLTHSLFRSIQGHHPLPLLSRKEWYFINSKSRHGPPKYAPHSTIKSKQRLFLTTMTPTE